MVRVKPHSEVITWGHRRPPSGTGVVWSWGLAPEVVEWCRERDMPLPDIANDPETPGGYILVFISQDHAFEFKMRWYK
jgi:hypothetical protein